MDTAPESCDFGCSSRGCVVSAACGDSLLIADDGTNGLRCLLAWRWLERNACGFHKEDADKVGRMLSAMAAGGDDPESLVRRKVTADSQPIGAAGSETNYCAQQLRLWLVRSLGAPLACAVMRVACRHGRLHPGLAPPLEGPVVNAEVGQQSAPDDVRAVIADEPQEKLRMLPHDAPGASDPRKLRQCHQAIERRLGASTGR